MEHRNVAAAVIVGAGTMGIGIAVAFANAAIGATLVDSDAAALDRAKAGVANLFGSAVSRGKLTSDDAQARAARISYAPSLAGLAAADVAIEAVVENLDVKRSVFAELGNVLDVGALLATNTSTLDIDAIAGAAPNPERSLGMHFFSPAHVMKLVEIVRGSRTDPAAIEAARVLCVRLGKIPVVVGNCDGFVGNRMLLGYKREAEFLVLEGATVARVDAVLEGFGFAMGPFAVSDLAGIDVGWRSKIERQKRGAEPPFRLTNLTDALVAAGRLGQKTSAGYYRYREQHKREPDDAALAPIVAAERERLGIAPRAGGGAEIFERCVYALVMEGGRILDDGIAASSGDIDTIWMNGYGFPRERGGPMQYARDTGIEQVRECIARLAERDPAFWRLSSFLQPRLP